MYKSSRHNATYTTPDGRVHSGDLSCNGQCKQNAQKCLEHIEALKKLDISCNDSGCGSGGWVTTNDTQTLFMYHYELLLSFKNQKIEALRKDLEEMRSRL